MLKKITFCLVFVTFTSCNPLPDEDVNAADFQAKIDNKSNKNVELLEFKKENAIKKNFMGMEIYEVEYSGKIKYLKDGFVKKNMFTDSNLLYVYDKKPKEIFCQCNFYKIIKDSEYKVRGKIIYAKTENGWLTNDKDISLIILPKDK